MTIKYNSTDRIHAVLEHIDIDEDGCWICNYKTEPAFVLQDQD